MYWENIRTGESDFREAPTTDEEAVDYLPQGAGVNLYKLYRETGNGIIESMIKVLTIAVGEKHEPSIG